MLTTAGKVESIDLIHEPNVDLATLVTFTVTNGETPVENATVYLYSFEGVTNENGQVSFYLFEEGYFEYMIFATGYFNEGGSLSTSDGNQNINVELEPEDE